MSMFATHVKGIARHHNEEVYALGKNDLDAIALLLNEKKYYFGDKPSSINAVLYAF